MMKRFAMMLMALLLVIGCTKQEREEAKLPNESYINIETIDQMATGYVLGCEGVSLYMALKGTGHLKDMDLDAFMATMPYGETPDEGYMGDPREVKSADVNVGKRTTIHPAPTAAWGSQYGTVTDLTGASLETLQQELAKGHVIVAWVTGNWEEPRWKKFSWGWEVENNHALCVVGYYYEDEDLYFRINDCYIPDDEEDGQYVISAADFEHCFEAAYKGHTRRFAISVS